jgi:hypothetical protein
VRPRQRRRARWFDAVAQQQSRSARVADRAAPASSLPAPLSSGPAAFDPQTSWRGGAPAAPSTVRPSAIGGLEVTTVLGPEFARPREQAPGSAASSPRRSDELSMEELIDLEQQVEFFVVLGQDEAAIALLDDYARGGGKSPLPYLQLLEIHQRRGEQLAYDRVRKSFNDRFDAEAPDWNADLHFGRSLDEYPQTIARLQSLWSTPLAAMQALDGLLFRRHPGDDSFDFPSYRELLFLYSIARDLSATVETDTGAIDLFLPLDDPPSQQGSPSPAGNTRPVDLDVSRWPEDAAAGESPPQRAAGRRSRY